MKLQRVKFDRFVGDTLTRTFTDKTHDLEYLPDQRAFRIHDRATGVVMYLDQTGAEWMPVVVPKAILLGIQQALQASAAKETDGGPAAPAAGQPPATPPRRKR